MSTRILDADQRSAALDHQRSFCVQAPAGSGKTELLTQRILKLLAHCERPEEVLAFTFTRKAAAEMRSRLLEALEQAAALCDTEGVPDAAQLAALEGHKRLTYSLALDVLRQDRLLGWQLLQNSQRLRINTIDSFTSWLTGRLPLGAGFGARPAITTDMQALFEEAVRQTLESLEQDGPAADRIASLLRHQHGNLRRCEALLLQLLEKRDQWLGPVMSMTGDPAGVRAALEDSLQLLLQDALEEAALRLVPFEPEIMQLLQFAANQSGNKLAPLLQACNFGAQFPPPLPHAAPSWQVLGQFFLTAGAAGLRKTVDVRHGFPAESHATDTSQKQLFRDMKALFVATVAGLAEAGLEPLLQRLALLPPARYEDEQWEVLADLAALLPLLAARLRAAMMANGVIDHTESALAALLALGDETEPTDLALQLDYRIRHILVDEFQDTSSMQFELLKRLTAGWSEGDGRTLFIVGDGMQSCYGFRNANVGLFLRAQERVGSVRMELLQLQVNFRSAPEVVQWVNTVFAGAFPAENDIARGGVNYSASTARPGARSGPGVHCRLLTAAEADPAPDSAALRRHEAEAVAALCLGLRRQHPGESIAILVRNRGVLAGIVPALRSAGLVWSAEDIDPLLSYTPINDLFTLLRALLNPADATAWLALLRCPFVGLALPDLEALALHARAQQLTLLSTLLQFAVVPGLGEEAQNRLQRVVPLLDAARGLWQTMPLADLLEQLWMELGGPACIEDASMYDNIDTFLRLVEGASVHGDIPDIHRFEQQLQRCHGSASRHDADLQIMTIHKAKGLEFDHVILPGLERKPRNDQASLLAWQEYIAQDGHAHTLLALAGSKGRQGDALHDYLKREANLRSSLEATRLLYIAVTRAVRSAWLFGTVQATKDGHAAPASSLLHTILPQLLQAGAPGGVDITPVAAASAPVRSPQQAGTQPFRLLPAQWQSPTHGRLLKPALPLSPSEPTHDPLAAMVGELVHQSLQAWVERDGDDTRTAPSRLALWRARLQPLCADAAAVDAALARVASQLQACLEDPASHWLFHQRHAEDACELALTDYGSGQRLDFSIDRTFVDADGVRWIIDYKSAQPPGDQSLAAFLQEQTSRYRPQLSTYARLLHALDGRAQRCALYFTALPLLHLVSTDSA